MKHIRATTRPLPAKADCGIPLFTANKTLADSACLFSDSGIFAGQLKLLFFTFR